MKNLLTQWELRRKTDPKLKPWGLLLFGFFAEAVKWLAALLSGAARPSCWRLNYRGWPAALLCIVEPSHWRLKCRGSGPSELEPLGASHCRCDVKKRREGCFRGRKNDRLMIGKKPPNPVGTEEENQGRKDLIVVQSSRINLCDQWCKELLHSQNQGYTWETSPDCVQSNRVSLLLLFSRKENFRSPKQASRFRLGIVARSQNQLYTQGQSTTANSADINLDRLSTTQVINHTCH